MIKIKQLVDEDFVNYRKPSMFIGFPSCSFKCDRECGKQACQNGTLATAPSVEISSKELAKRYATNPITEALVIGGLEPFDTYDYLCRLIENVRELTDDTIVIYTGYYKDEVQTYLDMLSKYKNIIVKFGRFVPDSKPIYDEILGVTLASCNQHAERVY